jgi:hypothetical protein
VPGAEARRLAGTVGAALEGVAQAAGAAGSGVAGKGAPAVAFRQALARWSGRVRDIESALDRRDGAFFLLVDQGSSDLGEVQVDRARTGSRSPAISEGLRTAAAAYRTLRSEYGREGVRQRQGGPLSAAEKAQLQRLQGAERQGLRDQARRRRDAVSAAELERFRAEAARIGKASLDLASYLNALIATSELRGEWSADAVHVRKSVPAPAMAAAEETVQDLYVDSDIGQVFTVDLGPAPAAAPAAGAAPGTEPAVQAYEAAPAEGTGMSGAVAGGEPVEAMEEVPAVDPATSPEEGSAAPAMEEEQEPAADPPPAAEPAAAAPAPAPPAPPQETAPPPSAPPESPVPPPIG